MKWFDEFFERQARAVAQKTSRRSALTKISRALVGTAFLLPVLPFARVAQAAHGGAAPDTKLDPKDAGALAEARSRPPPVVQPEPFNEETGRVICYPGDERHPVAERAIPGPSRLRHINGRFEPLGGFEDLFK